MAETIKDELTALLEELAENIRGEMASKGVNASGRTSASIRVVAEDTKLKLVSGGAETHTLPENSSIWTWNAAPALTLEVGRTGGNVPKGFYWILKEWSREKGLNFESEKERGTFAYFLARKIAREGTQRNRENITVFSPLVASTAEKVKRTYLQYVKAEIIERAKAFMDKK